MNCHILKLHAPVIPALDNNGVLPPELHNSPLIVEFKCWDNPLVGYTYRWTLDDWHYEGPEKSITEQDRAGDTLTLEIPASSLTPGIHSIGYLVRNPTSEVIQDSPAVQIIINPAP